MNLISAFLKKKIISFGILLQCTTAIGEGKAQLFSMRNSSLSLWLSISICDVPCLVPDH